MSRRSPQDHRERDIRRLEMSEAQRISRERSGERKEREQKVSPQQIPRERSGERKEREQKVSPRPSHKLDAIVNFQDIELIDDLEYRDKRLILGWEVDSNDTQYANSRIFITDDVTRYVRNPVYKELWMDQHNALWFAKWHPYFGLYEENSYIGADTIVVPTSTLYPNHVNEHFPPTVTLRRVEPHTIRNLPDNIITAPASNTTLFEEGKSDPKFVAHPTSIEPIDNYDMKQWFFIYKDERDDLRGKRLKNGQVYENNFDTRPFLERNNSISTTEKSINWKPVVDIFWNIDGNRVRVVGTDELKIFTPGDNSIYNAIDIVDKYGHYNLNVTKYQDNYWKKSEFTRQDLPRSSLRGCPPIYPKEMILIRFERFEETKDGLYVDTSVSIPFKRTDLFKMCRSQTPTFFHPQKEMRECDLIPNNAVFEINGNYVRDLFYTVLQQTQCQKFVVKSTWVNRNITRVIEDEDDEPFQAPIYDIFPDTK